MNSRDEKMVEYYTKHTLKDEDTFNFKCRNCGGCCSRSGEEPIIITGADIYHAAKALGMKNTLEFIQEYCWVNVGPTSHVPVMTLAMDDEGRCRLLKANRCTIQKNKPLVCAVYPLGRMSSIDTKSGEHKTMYFTQPPEYACAGSRTKNKITLRQWKDNFNLDERAADSDIWTKLAMPVGRIGKYITDEDKNIDYLTPVLYGFETGKPLEPQIKETLERVLEIEKKLEAFKEES